MPDDVADDLQFAVGQVALGGRDDDHRVDQRAVGVEHRRLLWLVMSRCTDQDPARRCQAVMSGETPPSPRPPRRAAARMTGTPAGKAASSRDGKARSRIDEDAAIVGAADQPAVGLAQPQPGDAVVVVRAAEYRLARAVQDVGARPRHPVEHDQAQRAARHVDPVAHRVGAEQAGILLGAEDVDQRRGRHRVDMLGQQQQAARFERRGDPLVHGAQPAIAVNRPSAPPFGGHESAPRRRRRPGRYRRAECR